MARLVAISMAWTGPVIERMVRRTWDVGDAVVMVPDAPPAAVDFFLQVVGAGVELVCDDAEQLIERRTGFEPAQLADGDALIVTSSGSTGQPKVLVHTQTGLQAHADAVHERLAIDAASDRWLACLPLNHLGGFGVLARAILTGTGVDVLDRFDERAVTAAPIELGSTLVSLVATALDRVDADPYRWVVLGGSADPTPRPGNVIHTYGLTETGGGVVYEGTPLTGVEVRLSPPIDDATSGRISLRTPSVARGRRTSTGEIAAITDVDGWIETGDLGRWDQDRLIVEGRADDLIITGGENVWPTPVEQALRNHPGVADVMVRGEPDPEWGQAVVALVVPADPADPPSLASLRATAKETLPAAWAPKRLQLVEVIPRTAIGKPIRQP